MIGKSPQIKKLWTLIEKVARSDSTVLITGESGTGKELVAREIHKRSPRNNGLFVPINCGAIPKELLESELFGYEKGAFTGAVRTKPGRFEVANGGTVFLDEIGDMGPELQVKVLRVIQERTFERVGGIKEICVDVRIVAATHRDLEQAVKQETFREDLFYRLNVIPIEVPPLRERKEDIPLLVDHFMNHFSRVCKRPPLKIEKTALDAMMAYDWPGNIRELENIIERLIVLTDGDSIGINDLPERIVGAGQREQPASSHDATQDPANPIELPKKSAETAVFSPVPGNEASDSSTGFVLPEEGLSLPDLIKDLEIDLIGQALDRANGVKSKAAKLLGLKRTTLIEKMKKLGILY